MALRHFLLTVPLGSFILTILVYFILPVTNLTFHWYELFALITAVNATVTVIAILLIPDGRKRRREG